MLVFWKENYDKPRLHIEKQRHHFANEGLYSQSYGFSGSYVTAGPSRRLSPEDLMLSNFNAGENS